MEAFTREYTLKLFAIYCNTQRSQATEKVKWSIKSIHNACGRSIESSSKYKFSKSKFPGPNFLPIEVGYHLLSNDQMDVPMSNNGLLINYFCVTF